MTQQLKAKTGLCDNGIEDHRVNHWQSSGSRLPDWGPNIPFLPLPFASPSLPSR